MLAQGRRVKHSGSDEAQATAMKRPLGVHSHSDPISVKLQDQQISFGGKEAPSEMRNTVVESTSQKPALQNARLPRHQSWTTNTQSSSSSRRTSLFGSSRRSRPSLTSSMTSASVSIGIPAENRAPESWHKYPWGLSRIRSSIKPSRVLASGSARPSIHPSEFRSLPEEPERHFIDSVGMVIPGVCNRSRCEHPMSHFVSNWRLCEPIEYTTALADHGITYSDFCRLMAALANFLDNIPNEPKRKQRSAPWFRTWRRISQEDKTVKVGVSLHTTSFKTGSIAESTGQNRLAEQQAESLNKLLKEITRNWQSRGLSVMVCISSYSLFLPNKISEAHVQILHASSDSGTSETVRRPLAIDRLSFIDPFEIVRSESFSVSRSQPSLKRRSLSPRSSASIRSNLHHHQQLQFRDRTRPWPLWPNAIPSQKRGQMTENADRYGVDPYFRAWLRANVNSRTTCTSYAKYMIEQEDDPFINTRLEYVPTPSKTASLCGLLTMGPKKWKMRYPGAINRKHYEHNRRLECRKTTEYGSRLRILRFGFRHPLYPPHTPEMDELGLTQEAYQNFITKIDDIRQNYRPSSRDWLPEFLASWIRIKIGRRSATDALNNVSEYVRKVNATGGRIVWTIERIPGVYDQGFGRHKQEWEISAWNSQDAFELLLELEKWGVIEKTHSMEDDE